MVLQFENSSPYIKRHKNKSDAYDLDLAIALSKSLSKIPGHSIMSPEDVQKMILEKINKLIQKNNDK